MRSSGANRDNFQEGGLHGSEQMMDPDDIGVLLQQRQRGSFKRLFPILDALEVSWSALLVHLGFILELTQLFALIFNGTYAWGPVIKGVSLAVYMTILPFWDQGYPPHASFNVNSVFVFILFFVLILLLVGLVYQAHRRMQRIRHNELINAVADGASGDGEFASSINNTPMVLSIVRVGLYLLSGPLFLPSLHVLLSVTVCGAGPTTAADLYKVSRLSLSAYPDRRCFKIDTSESQYAFALFVIGVVTMLILAAVKFTVTMMLYEDHPLSFCPRARSHGIVEWWFFVLQVTSAVLYHYLPSVGQRQTFSGLLCAASFLVGVLHVFYLPFFSHTANRVRTIGLFTLCYVTLCSTIIVHLGDKSLFAKNSLTGLGSNWDVALIVLGGIGTALICHPVADWRISARHKRDVQRLLMGAELSHNGPDIEEGKVRDMLFPWYLPEEERTEVNEELALWSLIDPEQLNDETKQGSPRFRHLLSPLSRTMSASVEDGARAGNRRFSSMVGMRSLASFASTTGTNAGYARSTMSTSHLPPCSGPYEHLMLAATIEAVYVPSDVEVAVRYLGVFGRFTGRRPPDACLGFASRIYAKGLTRFARDPWLTSQFTLFLFSLVSVQSQLALTLLEALLQRELSPVLSYRLHRQLRALRAACHLAPSASRSRKRASSTSSSQAHRLASERGRQKAIDTHQETLSKLYAFWSRLAMAEMSSAQLSRSVNVISTCTEQGGASYHQAVTAMLGNVSANAGAADTDDIATLLRYAQFAENVMMDKELAGQLRERALLLVQTQLAIQAAEQSADGARTDWEATTRMMMDGGGTLRAGTTHSGSQHHSIRRQRRWAFLGFGAAILLLIGFLIVIIVSYTKDRETLDDVHAAGRCRFYMMRCMWMTTVAVFSGASTTSDLWRSVREDLTALRTANDAITIKRPISTFDSVMELMKRPLHTYFYGHSGVAENMGLWRSGEIFISAMESIIAVSTGETSRADAFELVNTGLTGASTAYNHSLSSYIEESEHNLRASLYAVIALYIVMLIAICGIFFIIRYTLAKVSGARLGALGLFKLIPRQAVREMAARIQTDMDALTSKSKRVEDRVFADMLAANGLAQNTRAINGPTFYAVAAGASGRNAARGGDDGGKDERVAFVLHPPDSEPSAPAAVAAPTAGGAPPPSTTSLLAASRAAKGQRKGGEDDDANSTAEVGSEEAGATAPLSVTFAGAGGADAGGAGVTRGFARLSKNSSVADVGRIRFHHDGQYEQPYTADEFRPKQLTEAERLEEERRITDVDVDEDLAAITTGKQAKARHGASAMTGNGTTFSTDDTLDDDTHYDTVLASITGATAATIMSRQALPLRIAAVAFVAAIIVGAGAIFRLDQLDVDLTMRLEAVRTAGTAAFEMLGILESCEAVVFQPTDANLAELKSSMERGLGTESKVARMRTRVDSPTYTRVFAEGMLNFKRLERQAWAAAALACMSASTAPTPPNCALFADTTWSKNLFEPYPDEQITAHAVLDMPQGYDIDSVAAPAVQQTRAVSVIASNLYVTLKQSMIDSLNTTVYAMAEDEAQLIESATRKNRTATILMLVASIVMAIAMLGLLLLMISARRRMPLPYRLAYCLCVLCGIALLVMVAVTFSSSDERRDAFMTSLDRLRRYEMVLFTSYRTRENSKRAAFCNDALGAVDFQKEGLPAMQDAWLRLIEVMDPASLPAMTRGFDRLFYVGFIDAIVTTIACKVNGYDAAICALPPLGTMNWNLQKEANGLRIYLTYVGTSQILYTTRSNDMLSLTAAQQKELILSLSFGTLRKVNYAKGLAELEAVLNNYVPEAVAEEAERKHPMSYEITIAIIAIAFFSAFVLAVSIIVQLVTLVVRRHLTAASLVARRTSLSAAIGAGENSEAEENAMADENHLQRDAFAKRIMTRTGIMLWVATFFCTVLAVVLIASYADNSGRRDGYVLDGMSLRPAQLIRSAWYMEQSFLGSDKGTDRSWMLPASQSFTEDSISTATWVFGEADGSLNAPTLKLLYGDKAITYDRYSRDVIFNETLTGFEEQSPVVSFGGVIVPSQWRWHQRVAEMMDMSTTERAQSGTVLRQQMLDFTDVMYESVLRDQEQLTSKRDMWLAIDLVLFGIALIVFLIVAYYILVPSLGRVQKEEENTHAMLRMIPTDIRQMVPAIDEYLTTGVIEHDASIMEIEAATHSLTQYPTIVIDSEGIMVRFCHRAEEEFLWPSSEVLGKNVRVLMPESIAQEHDRYIKRFLETSSGRMTYSERTVVAKRKDGTTFVGRSTIQAVRSSSGRLNFIGVVRPWQQQLAVEQRCGLLRRLVEAAVCAVVVIEPNGTIIRFGAAAERLFRCTAAEVVGRKVNVLMPRTEATAHDANLARYLHTGQRTILGSSRFVRAKRLNGELFSVLLNVHELRRGGRVHFVGYIKDMTERLHLEMLAAAGTLLKTQSPSALFIVSADGIITHASSPAARLFGYATKELVGQHLSMVMEEQLAMQFGYYCQTYVRGPRVSQKGGKMPLRIMEGTARRRETPDKSAGGGSATNSVVGLTQASSATEFGFFSARATIKGFRIAGSHPQMLLVVEDTTNQRALEATSLMGRTILALSPIPIVVFTGDGAIAEMNEAAEEMFECSESEAYGADVSRLFYSDDATGGMGVGVGEERLDGTIGSLSPSARSGRERRSPIAQFLEDFRLTGTSSLLGRHLRSTTTTAKGTRQLPVEIMIREVEGAAGMSAMAAMAAASNSTRSNSRAESTVSEESESVQGLGFSEGRAFLAYIRDTTRSHDLGRARAWGRALMRLPGATPVLCLNLGGEIVACSDSTCESFRWSRDDLVGQPLVSLLSRDSRAAAMELIASLNHGMQGAEGGGGGVAAGADVKGDAAQRGGGKAGRRKRDAARAAAAAAASEEVGLVGCTRGGAEVAVRLRLERLHIDGESEAFIVAHLRLCAEEDALERQRVAGSSMVSMSPAAVIGIMSDGIVCVFSRAAEELFGYPSTAVLGRRVAMLMPPDIGERHDGFIRAYEKTGQKVVLGTTRTVTARHRDGTFFTIELSVDEVDQGVSAIEGQRQFIAFARDVSMSRRKERAARLGQAVAGLLAVPSLELKLDGTILHANGYVQTVLGYPEGTLEARAAPITDVFPEQATDRSGAPVDQKAWLTNATTELLQTLRPKRASVADTRGAAATTAFTAADGTPEMAADGTVTQRLVAKMKSGKNLWCEVQLRLIVIYEGEAALAHLPPLTPSAAQASITPAEDGTRPAPDPRLRLVLTARSLRMDERLEEHREMGAAVLAVSPTPLIWVEQDGKISRFSHAAEEVLGYSAGEMEGKSVLQLLPPDMRMEYRNYLDRFATTGVTTISGGPARAVMVNRKDDTPLSMQLVLRQLVTSPSTSPSHSLVLEGERRVDTPAQPPSFLLVLAEDVLSRAAAVEAAREPKLLKDAPLAVLSTDADGIVTGYSAAAEALLGFQAVEVLGRASKDVFPSAPLFMSEGAGGAAPPAPTPTPSSTGQAFLAKAMSADPQLPRNRQESLRLTRADGTTFAARVTVVVIGSMAEPRVVAYIENLEGQRAAARESAAAMRPFHSSPMGLWVLASRLPADGAAPVAEEADELRAHTLVVTESNAAGASLLARTREEMTGTNALSLLVPRTATGGAARPHKALRVVLDALQRAATGAAAGTPPPAFRMERVPLRRHDGIEVVVSVVIAAISPEAAGAEEPTVLLGLSDATDLSRAAACAREEASLAQAQLPVMHTLEVDPDGKILRCGEQLATALGHADAKALRGLMYTAVLPPGERTVADFIRSCVSAIGAAASASGPAATAKAARAALRLPEPPRQDLLLRRADGGLLKGSGVLRGVLHAEGNALLSVVMHLQLTSQAAALPATDVVLAARNDLTMELMTEGLALVRGDGRVCRVNDAFMRLVMRASEASLTSVPSREAMGSGGGGNLALGGSYSADDVTDAPLGELLAPLLGQVATRLVRQLKEYATRGARGDLMEVGPDGEALPVVVEAGGPREAAAGLLMELTVRPVPAPLAATPPSNEHTYTRASVTVSSVATPVTSPSSRARQESLFVVRLRSVEKEHVQAQEQIVNETALTHSPVAMVVLDASGAMCFLSPAAEALFGVASGAVAGQEMAAVLLPVPEEQAMVRNALSEFRRTKATEELEVPRVVTARSRVTVEMMLRELPPEVASTFAVVAYFRQV